MEVCEEGYGRGPEEAGSSRESSCKTRRARSTRQVGFLSPNIREKSGNSWQPPSQIIMTLSVTR